MAKFTKSEMLEEFRDIVFQYARGTSFVLEPEAGYRLLFGKNPDNSEDLYRFMNPEAKAAPHDQSFSIEHYQATRSIEQFYDYGLHGIRNVSLGSVSGATEWTFAYGLIHDTAKSFLICETRNGEPAIASKCLHAAKAFFARLILDGNDRISLDGSDGPENMLTIAEVAILADLDERTVRNATSKNAAHRLETSVVESNIYIPRESALAWLQNKRGFIPSRIGEELTSQAVLNYEEFTSVKEAGDFIRANRERMNYDYAELEAKASSSLTKKDLKAIESGQIIGDETSLTAIGNALGLYGPLLALRLIEVVKKEEMQTLRRRISAASSFN